MAKSKMKKAKSVSKKPAKKPVKPAKKAIAKAVAKSAAPKAAGKADFKAKSQANPSAANKEFSKFFNPLDDRVVVAREEALTRTPGGLYIPDTVTSGDRFYQGRVLAVGRGRLDKKGRLMPLDVQLGDLVLYSSYSGSDIKMGTREVVILRESEILGVRKP